MWVIEVQKTRVSLPGMGARIKSARKRRRWTQQALADRLGVHLSTIARLETDRIGVSLPVFARLCRELEADPAELIGVEPRGSKAARVRTIAARLAGLSGEDLARVEDYLALLEKPRVSEEASRRGRYARNVAEPPPEYPSI